MKGVIRLGGQDIKLAKFEELRTNIGMVTQEVQMFAATVRDNLTLFDHEIPDDQILQVLRDLGLYSWYASLPDGLDTRTWVTQIGLVGRPGAAAGVCPRLPQEPRPW